MLRHADVSPERGGIISSIKKSKNKVQAGHVEHAVDVGKVRTYTVDKP
jgi:hypothetical protein